MTDRIRSLLIVHYDMHRAKALAGLVVKEHDVYIYLTSVGARVGEFLQNIGIDLIIASQELPDTTGIELFADLSCSHPDVVRVLLLSGDEDVKAEEAVRRGVIDHYLVEPLETSALMNILEGKVRRGFTEVESPLEPSGVDFVPSGLSAGDGDGGLDEGCRPDTVKPIEQEVLPGNLAFEEAEVVPQELLEEQEELIQIVDAGSDAVPLYGMGVNAVGELAGDDETETPPPDLMKHDEEETGQSRETRVESSQENEQLRNRLDELRLENAALLIAQQRNSRFLEESANLSREKELQEQQTAWMGLEVQRLQTELRKAREQLDELAVMPKLENNPVASNEMRYRNGPMDIYEKAAELNRQLCQARQSNSMLDLNLRNRERELSEVNEELDLLRKSLDDARKAFQRELREYQKNCAFLKRGIDSCESSCKSLRRENAELFERLSWVQAEWDQLLKSRSLK